MAELLDDFWTPSSGGLVARDRRGGAFRTYHPDRLMSRPLVLPSELAALAARREREIRALSSSAGANDLERLSRFLLRSEAIASSMIEGIAPSAQQVALAELAQDEPIRGFSEQAGLVANNITIMRRASVELAAADWVTVESIVDLHTALLPHNPRHHGLRTVQNWIGGSNWHPLEAEFVPPPPAMVPALMTDVVDYLNGSLHGPLIQAALIHAQFETIHPFTDGNGRVGRALIHNVLARTGIAPRAVLPISPVLATIGTKYVAGLTSYRYVAPDGSEAAMNGIAAWLTMFLDAVSTAISQAKQVATEIAEVRDEWDQRLETLRKERGLRARPRAGSATARILESLPEVPVMTARTVERIMQTSFPVARDALEELADAGVLTRKSVDRGTTGYLARDVLDLLTLAERRLSSTQFDTRVSPAAPGAPTTPKRREN